MMIIIQDFIERNERQIERHEKHVQPGVLINHDFREFRNRTWKQSKIFSDTYKHTDDWGLYKVVWSENFRNFMMYIPRNPAMWRLDGIQEFKQETPAV